MPPRPRPLALLTATLLCAPAVLFGGEADPWSWRFNRPDDLLGWKAEGFREIGVAGGAIRGRTAKLSFLYSPTLNLDADKRRVFVFTARVGRDGNGRIYFRRPGETFAEDRAVSFDVTGDSRFHDYAVDMSDHAHWRGTIEQVRFDILYIADTQVGISRMGLVAAGTDEKTANVLANGDFENPAWESPHLPDAWRVSATPDGSFALAAAPEGGTAAQLALKKPDARVALRQRVHYDDTGGYDLELDYRTGGPERVDLALALTFTDIFGNPLPDAPRHSLAPPQSTEWRALTQAVQVPKDAAGGEVELCATSSFAGGEVWLDHVRLARHDGRAGASPTPAGKGDLPPIPSTMTRPEGPVRNPTAALRHSNGAPAFVVNGRAHTALHYLVDDTTAPGLIANCRDNGIHIYMLNVSDIPWTASDGHDLSRVDAICAHLLAQDPAAYFILALALDDVNSFGRVLKGWADGNPAERAVDSDGSTDIPQYGGKLSHVPSLASRCWQDAVEDLIRRLIRRVRGSRYGERVIGYMPASGVTYEWQQWGSAARPPVFVDYSEPARQAFIAWAKRKYADLAVLNAAWKGGYSAFDDIAVPSKSDRLRSDFGLFLDPEKSRREIDYRAHYSEQVAHVILRLAGAIKEETHGESLCGVYYGYVTHVLGPYRCQLIGHFALGKVLDSPDIDFLMSPSDYGDRQIGGGAGFMSVVGSVKLHGKAWIDQADLRTWRSTQNIGRLANLPDAKAGWMRHFGDALVHGACEQIYDFSLGWTAGDPRLMRLMGRLREVEERTMSVSRDAGAADRSIAVIVDEKSTYYTAMASGIHLDAVVSQHPALCRTGAGFDSYLLDDLPTMPEYKCYLFLNTFRITRAQQAFIDDRLKKNGHTLVFVYAPGITDENRLLPERVSQITGIKMEVLTQESPLGVVLAATGHPILKHLKEVEGYGAGNPYSPVFVPTEGDILGTLNGHPDKAGLAIKCNPGWTCVYSAVPGLPAQLLRGIAEHAGVRISNPTDGDVTYVGGAMTVVHTAVGGRRTLRCGAGAKQVEDLVTGRTHPVQDGAFAVEMEARSTSLFLER